jgi:DNA-binding CsgD family transcriptional regulator
MPVGGLLDRALLREIGLNAADVTQRACALQASAQQARAQARRIRLQSQQLSLARAADRREQAADRREQAADRREQAADRREQAADRREQAADRREQAADRREQAADRREQAADRREARQTERERSADRAADERDRAADDRDRAANERDQVIDNLQDLPPTEYPAASVAAANRYPMVRVGSTGEVGTEPGWASLTDGELRVVAAVAQGMSNRGIAKQLHLSRHTVDAHLKHVYLKLAIHTRVQLTVLALQHSA